MLKFSDLWGIVPSSVGLEWLSSSADSELSIEPREVLRFGRGGLRMGSWVSLTDTEKNHIRPSSRVRRLFSSSGADIVSQKNCSAGDPKDVDDTEVFPLAQIVQASMPVHACARYVVEALKYRILQNSEKGVSLLSTVMQDISAQRWEQRCNNQMHLVSVCDHFDVFEAMPSVGRADPKCPFIMETGNTAYVSSGCIVYISSPTNKFFDPCLPGCHPCKGEEITQTSLETKPECALPIDPRNLSTDWGAKVPQSFVDMVLDHLEKNDEVEAPAQDLPEELCDGIVDWWPDTWTEPVGYHVTTPCHPEEAGYRVFDSAFAVERDDNDFDVVKIRYHHDTFRDPVMGAVNFGTSGLCRQTDYGMPLFDINTVRVCTRSRLGESFDPTLPMEPNASRLDFSAEKCAPSPNDMPWTPLPDSTAAERAVGTLPLWDGNDGSTMPAAGSTRAFVAGVSAGVNNNRPSFLTKPKCDTDQDCRAPLGNLKCLGGVCMPVSVECTKHGDCDKHSTCNGVGQCVLSRMTVENKAPFEVQVQIYSEEEGGCGNSLKAIPTLGKSQWGKIDKLLQTYGLCGYHEWFDYTTNIDLACNNSGCESVKIRKDDPWHVSTADKEKGAVNIFRSSGYMHIHPHECDVDFQYAYSHMCVLPGNSNTNKTSTFQTFSFGPNQTDIDSQSVDIYRLSMAKNGKAKKLGFLGIEDSVEWKPGLFKRCDTVMQCTYPPFTWNGVVHKRRQYAGFDG